MNTEKRIAERIEHWRRQEREQAALGKEAVVIVCRAVRRELERLQEDDDGR